MQREMEMAGPFLMTSEGPKSRDGPPVTETIYTHVISKDGKRIAAQLSNAVWGILDASWTEKRNGLGVEPPKPFIIN